MRLHSRIMWLVIISSVAQLAFSSDYSARWEQQSRIKRMHHDQDEDSSNGPATCEQNEKAQEPHKMSRGGKSRSTGIAVKAALEAKQANDDMAGAVKAASDKIKLEYAEKAAVAAKAAQAVLAGKLQVLEQLEMEVREAEIVVQEESQELCAAEANNQLALKAHQQAQDVLKLLIAGLKLARDNYDSSEQVSATCQQSMSEKTALMEAAQKRVNLLMRQLSEARNDYARTKKAAYRALCAANEAKQRIQQNAV